MNAQQTGLASWIAVITQKNEVVEKSAVHR
jgi:hypothetical protein